MSHTLTWLTLVSLTLGIPALAAPGPGAKETAEKIRDTLSNIPHSASARAQDHGPNSPTPELETLVTQVTQMIESNSGILSVASQDPFVAIMRQQTLNHLLHISLSFEMAAPNYTHGLVMEGPYPFEPTLRVLSMAEDFLSALESKDDSPIEIITRDTKLLERLLAQQHRLIKKLTASPFEHYSRLSTHLKKKGRQAPVEELLPVVQYLEHELVSKPELIEFCKTSAACRSMVRRNLTRIREILPHPGEAPTVPYLNSILAIERSVGFFDVLQRALHPDLSPPLYHSARYEYYLHYVLGTLPDHVLLPTLATLTEEDLLRLRSVPIGLVGVATDMLRVDGFWQTPYEFFIHDINHIRRMFQFSVERARQLGMSLINYAKYSEAYLSQILDRVFKFDGLESAIEIAWKKILKMVFFEIFHEDALPADPEITVDAILRPPLKLTPFERLDVVNRRVTYVMEKGATLLAYVFRKLVHDFYDTPENRNEELVEVRYRTRKDIVNAVKWLFDYIKVERKKYPLITRYIKNDVGFPPEFEANLRKDIERRALTDPTARCRLAFSTDAESVTP